MPLDKDKALCSTKAKMIMPFAMLRGSYEERYQNKVKSRSSFELRFEGKIR